MSEPTGPAPASPMPVPPLLRDAAGWAWRLLIVALAAYLLVRLLELLYLLVLPLFAAVLAAALVAPLVSRLRHLGVPRAAATWLTVAAGLAVIGGIGWYVVNRASAEYPALVDQVSRAVTDGRNFLVNRVHVRPSSIDNIQASILRTLNEHRQTVAQGVITGVSVIGEALAGAVLWFFITFFLLYDGDRIWHWLVGLFPATARLRVHGSGERAWERLSGYVRGTFVIAVVHGVVVGVTLMIMNVPLVAPLALLVFLGSFVPIIGAVLFGGLAVVVTLVVKGWVFAVVLVVVLLVDNQVEAHVMQPFLVGRYVHLHPLAVAVAIAAGGLLEGIPGAILAVPIVAAVDAVVRHLSTGAESPVRTGERPVTAEIPTLVKDEEELHP